MAITRVRLRRGPAGVCGLVPRMSRRFTVLFSLLGSAGGCAASTPDSSLDSGAGPAAEPLVVVTFNSGTSEGLGGGEGDNGGYSDAHATLSDDWYGDGLAWVPAVDATTAFFEAVSPDIVVFQEVFWTGECPEIPEDAQGDFVCEEWEAGDPTVAQRVLGPGWQVACHPGHADKCAAVHERAGRFEGCEDDFCLEGLAGSTVDGCGSGARVGRGVIIRPDGTRLTLVNVHGSSGISGDDQDCRVAQVDQAFVDLGDGEPAANGTTNLVLGDLNTDPGRWSSFDPSASRWLDFVGGSHSFRFHTEVGADAPGSYQGVADIDHVMSDGFSGGCQIAGLDPELSAVIDAVYFDHRPVVCTLLPQTSEGS
jgi:hypothetical protein